MKSIEGMALTAIMALVSGASFAHPGALNQDGCHDGTEPYHCHRQNGEHHPFATNPTCNRQWGVDADGNDTITGPLTRFVSGQQIQICDVMLTLTTFEVSGKALILDMDAEAVVSQFEGATLICTITGKSSGQRQADCRL